MTTASGARTGRMAGVARGVIAGACLLWQAVPASADGAVAVAQAGAPGAGCTVVPAAFARRVEEAMQRRIDASVPASVRARLAESGNTPRYWRDGADDVRADVFWVEVDRMPPGMAPEVLLRMMVDDYYGLFFVTRPEDLRGSEFLSRVTWPYALSGRRRVGDIVNLRFQPDAGGVVYTAIEPSYFAVQTVDTVQLGTHPVAGSREWGFVREGSGAVRFYTASVEAAFVPGTGIPGSFAQRDVWTALMRDLARTITRRGGTVSRAPAFADGWLEDASQWLPRFPDGRPGSRPPRSEIDVQRVLRALGICARRAAEGACRWVPGTQIRQGGVIVKQYPPSQCECREPHTTAGHAGVRTRRYRSDAAVQRCGPPGDR